MWTDQKEKMDVCILQQTFTTFAILLGECLSLRNLDPISFSASVTAANLPNISMPLKRK